jgi:hypothetical protein
MGEGAALVAAERWPDAATVYERAVGLAEAAQDLTMTLEAWRMAAWCHEQAGADGEAWRCGQQALKAGEALPEAQRAQSTLPWVGELLLRLLERNYNDPRHAEQVQAQLVHLLGPEWAPGPHARSAAA